LGTHIDRAIRPALDRAIRALETNGSSKYLTQSLSKDQMIISPSDLGFHNALKDKSGVIHFIDFEYFGWDDPAKLALDFLLHPAMNLSSDLKNQWIQGCNKIFGQDFKNRVKVYEPFIRIAWSIIVLNEFREDVWHKRSGADPEKMGMREAILANQLLNSLTILEGINEN
jgi:thiamine kinase-like enzyme